jgi:hypothetical protein
LDFRRKGQIIKHGGPATNETNRFDHEAAKFTTFKKFKPFKLFKTITGLFDSLNNLNDLNDLNRRSQYKRGT